MGAPHNRSVVGGGFHGSNTEIKEIDWGSDVVV